MPQLYATLTLSLRIDDPRAVKRQAKDVALKPSLSTSEWRAMRKNLGDDVIMPLNPGADAPDGCVVIDCGVELFT